MAASYQRLVSAELRYEMLVGSFDRSMLEGGLACALTPKTSGAAGVRLGYPVKALDHRSSDPLGLTASSSFRVG
jgi:hypothetical protein